MGQHEAEAMKRGARQAWGPKLAWDGGVVAVSGVRRGRNRDVAGAED